MLFNAKQFNTAMFDGGAIIATVYSTDTAVFNDFSISDGTNMIMQTLIMSGPSRVLISGDIPRGDGQYLTADYFREYTIEASGYVKRSTAASLDAYLDTIRQNLWTREANLDIIDTNGTVKRFAATVDNFDEMFADRKYYDITICPFKIKFKCKTPFGKSRSYSSYFTQLTSSPSNQSVVNGGTYKAQPVILLVFTSASSVTTVTIKNTTTGEQISYTGSIAAGDVFIADSEQKTVTKNATAVSYSGTFPSLSVGTNVITYTIDGSFAVDVTERHKLTYL